MPSLPEFTDILGKIGPVEILHEIYSQDPGCADRNGGIARKIAVYLECEKKGGNAAIAFRDDLCGLL